MGIKVIDLRTGNTVHWLWIEGNGFRTRDRLAKNAARRVVLPKRSNPTVAGVACRIALARSLSTVNSDNVAGSTHRGVYS